MQRPLLRPGIFLVLIFTRGWVDPRTMVQSEGNMSLKNPVTPPEIYPGTVRVVAQRLKHYATPGPHKQSYFKPKSHWALPKQWQGLSPITSGQTSIMSFETNVLRSRVFFWLESNNDFRGEESLTLIHLPKDIRPPYQNAVSRQKDTHVTGGREG